MGSLLRSLGKAASVGADAITGYQADRKNRLDESMRGEAAKRQQAQDALSQSLGQANLAHLDAQTAKLTAPPLEDPETFGDVEEGILNDEPIQFLRGNRGTLKRASIDGQNVAPLPKPAPIAPRDPVADHKANREFDIAHPLPQSGGSEDRTLVQVQQPDGSVVYLPRSQAAGMQAPRPGTQGSAALRKAIASNQSQLSNIDDAIKELNAHPDAVGIKRGLGDIAGHLPIVGNTLSAIQDAANTRVDPGGVPARASMANIASLVIHDRSGAAVTVSEFPRLRPFIPGTNDNAVTAIAKLQKLRQMVGEETGNLEEQVGGGSGPAPTSAPRPITQDQADYLKSIGQFDPKKYTITR